MNFSGIPAGAYTAKVTIGKTSVQKTFTVEAKPAVTITNLSVVTANSILILSGKIAQADADEEVELVVYLGVLQRSF